MSTSLLGCGAEARTRGQRGDYRATAAGLRRAGRCRVSLRTSSGGGKRQSGGRDGMKRISLHVCWWLFAVGVLGCSGSSQTTTMPSPLPSAAYLPSPVFYSEGDGLVGSYMLTLTASASECPGVEYVFARGTWMDVARHQTVAISIPQSVYSRRQERDRSFAEPGRGPATQKCMERQPVRHFHLLESLQPARDARRHTPLPAQ